MIEFLKYVNEVVKNHPELNAEIMDLVQLCSDEIEAGESQEHEIELCMEDIRQLIEEE
jgi:antitoxin component HigA of HigAB toxin-antitoxin module